MVGVPRSRGCAACRKQKKKCDGVTPPCTRCKRLSIPCIGLGQQRFKFQDEGQKFALVSSSTPPYAANNDAMQDFSVASLTRNTSSSVPQILSNNLTRLASGLVASIDPELDVRVQLLWNFGWFLEDIPCRLGVNESLDAAVEALLTAHMAFRAPQRQLTELCLSKYCRALKALQYCLADLEKAQSSETLCSTLLLLIYEALSGSPERSLLNHAGGAARILQSRGQAVPKSEFERKLFLSLRSPVIMQAIFDPKVQFSTEEWKGLVEDAMEDATDSTSIESESLKCLARVPNLLKRARAALGATFRDRFVIYDLQQQTRDLRDTSTQCRVALCERLRSLSEGFASPEAMPPQLAILHAYYARSTGMALATDILINCLLAALEGNSGELQKEISRLSLAICNLAGEVSCRRPLGTLYMLFVLRIAYVGANDLEAKDWIDAMLLDFMCDIYGSGAHVERTELDRLTRYLRLQDVAHDWP